MSKALPAIAPDEFVELVEPLLERRDVCGLMDLLKSRWKPEQIQELLESDHLDARKVALLAIAMVGKSCCLPTLARHLHDPDPVIRELAEHAMWGVWLRMGRTPEANHEVARGAQALERREFEHAIRHFDRAIEIDPSFPEAFNQRAIAHYLLEEYEASIRDCEEAVRRMPLHFGALSGLGHCYLHLGKVRQAITSYQQALAVHPYLGCIRQAVTELQSRLPAFPPPPATSAEPDHPSFQGE